MVFCSVASLVDGACGPSPENPVHFVDVVHFVNVVHFVDVN